MSEVVAPMLLSVAETSIALGVGRSTVYVLLGLGELEAVKIGSRRLVTAESVTCFVDRLRSAEGGTNV